VAESLNAKSHNGLNDIVGLASKLFFKPCVIKIWKKIRGLFLKNLGSAVIKKLHGDMIRPAPPVKLGGK
jgi:hypothetical protein